ncbi:FAD-binding oxidoreductase [Microbulbifer sp. PSTR4-B]|uniref:FAD-binding oxidoreductase n=1 Tax=Microbulbifer sp. PSTR4-B TaxID=3243396 RepID=UPI004039C517
MIRDFLLEIKKTFRADQVVSEQDEIAQHIENVTSYNVDVPLILYPESAEEVRQIVLNANKFKVCIQPFSTGKSWGFGSKLSTQGDLILVDLHRMNKIIEVNEEFGYAVIEPGVTQFQLFNYLNEAGSKYFSDTTGSAKDTSIVGNALDKGVGYNMERYKQLLNLEVVLGDGRIFKTGFGHYANCKATNTFPDGIGPSYLRIFLQSNFGVVTRATIELRRRPEKKCMFLTVLKDESYLGDAINALKGIKQLGLVNSITHYYENVRVKNGLAPVMYQDLKGQGVDIDRESLMGFLNRCSFGAGVIFSNISGTKYQIKAAKKELKRLSPWGITFYVTDRLINLGLYTSKLVGWKKMNSFIHCNAGFYRMALGEPSDRPIMSIYWPAQTELPEGWENPDHTDIGMHFILPTVPMNVEYVQQANSIVRKVNTHYSKAQASYAFGLVDDKTTHFSISTHFIRTDKVAREESRSLAKELNEEFIKAGFHPNRLFVDFMDLVVDPDDIFWQVTRDIKKVFDPNGVIAPGHYNLT